MLAIIYFQSSNYTPTLAGVCSGSSWKEPPLPQLLRKAWDGPGTLISYGEGLSPLKSTHILSHDYFYLHKGHQPRPCWCCINTEPKKKKKKAFWIRDHYNLSTAKRQQMDIDMKTMKLYHADDFPTNSQHCGCPHITTKDNFNEEFKERSWGSFADLYREPLPIKRGRYSFEKLTSRRWRTPAWADWVWQSTSTYCKRE